MPFLKPIMEDKYSSAFRKLETKPYNQVMVDKVSADEPMQYYYAFAYLLKIKVWKEKAVDSASYVKKEGGLIYDRLLLMRYVKVISITEERKILVSGHDKSK